MKTCEPVTHDEMTALGFEKRGDLYVSSYMILVHFWESGLRDQSRDELKQYLVDCVERQADNILDKLRAA